MKKPDLSAALERLRPLLSFGRKDALSRAEAEMVELDADGGRSAQESSPDDEGTRKCFRLPSFDLSAIKARFQKKKGEARVASSLRREDFVDDIAYESAVLSATLTQESEFREAEEKRTRKKREREAKEKQKAEEIQRRELKRSANRKPMKMEAALAISIGVFGVLTAGAWKGMEYGVAHVKKERLLGRSESQPVEAPIKIKDLPLLRSGIGSNAEGNLEQNLALQEGVNEIFSPRRLMSPQELEKLMAEKGLDIDGQPLPPPPPPEPAEEDKPKPVDFKKLYAELVRRSFVIDSVSPGAGVFLNGDWFAVGQVAKEDFLEGKTVTVSIKAVSASNVVFDVNGLSVEMDTAS